MGDVKDIIVSIPQTVLDAARQLDDSLKAVNRTAQGINADFNKAFGTVGRGMKPVIEVLNSLDKNVASISKNLESIGAKASGSMGAMSSEAKRADSEVKKLVSDMSSVTDIIGAFSDKKNNPFMDISKWEVGDLKEYIALLKESRDSISANPKDNEATRKAKERQREEHNQELALAEFAYKHRTSLEEQRHSVLEKWAKKYYADNIESEKRLTEEAKKRTKAQENLILRELNFRTVSERTSGLLSRANATGERTGKQGLIKEVSDQYKQIEKLYDNRAKMSAEDFVAQYDKINKKLSEARAALTAMVQDQERLARKAKETTSTKVVTGPKETDVRGTYAAKYSALGAKLSGMGAKYGDFLNSGKGSINLAKALEAVEKSMREYESILTKGASGDVKAWRDRLKACQSSVSAQISALNALVQAESSALKSKESADAKRVVSNENVKKSLDRVSKLEKQAATRGIETASLTAKKEEIEGRYERESVEWKRKKLAELDAERNKVRQLIDDYNAKANAELNATKKLNKANGLVSNIQGNNMGIDTTELLARANAVREAIAKGVNNGDKDAYSRDIRQAIIALDEEYERIKRNYNEKIKDSSKKPLQESDVKSIYLSEYDAVSQKWKTAESRLIKASGGIDKYRTQIERAKEAEEKFFQLLQRGAEGNVESWKAQLEAARKSLNGQAIEMRRLARVEEEENRRNASRAEREGKSKTALEAQRRMHAIQTMITNLSEKQNWTEERKAKVMQRLNQSLERQRFIYNENANASNRILETHRKLLNWSDQLANKLALTFSVSSMMGYAKKMVDVRAEMELQQRSLEAIIQNKDKADALFNKTVESALKSPFKIKELVTYTKQLAAYRIESDKLFDTTKRLADVSAGLGVDMQRLILAYGQVKAAAYLRGQEVRQFTEAGINMYGELQKYFQEVKGEAHTTAEIVQMISDKRVTFEDVENVLKRMTDEGGMFYKMQEIQSETLSGKLGKLQDAFDMMYNSIGKNTEWGLKGFVDLATVLTQNWEKVWFFIKRAGEALVALKIAQLKYNATAGAGALTFKKFLEGILSGNIGNDKIMGSLGKTTQSFVSALTTGLAKAGKVAIAPINMLGNMISAMTPKFVKTNGAVQLLGSGLRMLGASGQAAAVGIRTLMSSIAPLLLASLALEGVIAIIGKISDFVSLHDASAKTFNDQNAKLQEINRTLNKNIEATNSQVESTKEVTSETDKAKQATEKLAEATVKAASNSKELEKNISKSYKAAISSLVSLLKENGINITESLLEMDDAQIAETYGKLRDFYEEFLRQQREIEERIESNNYWDMFFTADGINTDIKDYMTDMNDFLDTANINAMNDAIHNLEENYDDLNDKTREYYNEIRNGREDGESQIHYYERVFEALNKIQGIDDFGQINPMRKGLLRWDKSSLLRAKDELKSEIKEIFGEIEKGLDEVEEDAEKRRIKMHIDKVAVKEGWDDAIKEIAYETYEIPVGIDQDHIEAQANTALETLRRYLDGRTFKVNISFESYMKDEFKGFFDAQRAAVDQVKVYKGYLADLKRVKSRKEPYSYSEFQESMSNETWAMITGMDKKNPKKIVQTISDDNKKVMYMMKDAADKNNLSLKDAGKEIADKNKKTVKETFSYVRAQDQKAYEQEVAKTTATRQQLINGLEALIAMGDDITDFTGMEPKGTKHPKQKKKKTKSSKGESEESKQARAQIDMIKKMQDEYDKLRKRMSEESALELLAKNNERGLAALKMTNPFSKENLPTEQNAADAMEALLPKVDPNHSKSIWENILGLRDEVATKEFDKKLEGIKKDIDSAFDGLNILDSLMDNGYAEYQVRNLPIFRDIVKNADEVRAIINERLSNTEGLDEKKVYEDYLQQLDKFENERLKRDTEYVLKNYRLQVSEMIQLDRWYYEEKKKIDAKDKNGNYIFSETERNEYIRNLQKDYDKKADENKWKDYRESGAYVNLFGNLDNLSSKTIDRLSGSFDRMRNSLSHLDPSNLREVAQAQQQLWDAAAKKDPFGEMIKSIKEIRALRESGDTEENLNNGIIARTDEITALEESVRLYQREIDKKEELIASGAANSRELAAEVEIAKEFQQNTLAQIDAKKQENREDEKKLQLYAKQRNAAQNLASTIGDIASKEAKAYEQIKGLLSSFGIDELDMIWADMGQQVVQTTLQVAQYALKCKAAGTAMNSMLGVIGWIAMGIEAIVSIWSAFNKAHDARLEKQIKNLQRQIEDLQEAMEDLQQAFDDAFDTSVLVEYNDKLKENIQLQIKNIQAQIAAERAKKDSDEEKIRDYEKAIKDLNDQLKEQAENMTESLGGIGSQSGYKSAAQEFADAWYDAFKQGESGLDALDEKFDDLFDNLIKKQIMMRASKKFIEPLLEELDKIVSQDSSGGYDVDQEELDKWRAHADERLAAYNEYSQAMMEAWGISPNGTELSALQKGIQGVTEETASALEGIMESMRFYLATQQSDVAAIRAMLESQYGTVDNNSPMLTELRTQTQLLRTQTELQQAMSTAFYNGGNGYGMRTYIQ